MPQSTGWSWSPTLKAWFYYDASTGEHVLADGRRVRLPALQSVPQPNPQTEPPPQFSVSPPGQGFGYPFSPSSIQGSSIHSSALAGFGREVGDVSGRLTQQPSSRLAGSDLAVNLASLSLDPLPQRGETRSRVLHTKAGDEILETVDPRSKVVSWVQSAPADRITDPKLLEQGLQAHKKLYGTPRDTELDPGRHYDLRSQPSAAWSSTYTEQQFSISETPE